MLLTVVICNSSTSSEPAPFVLCTNNIFAVIPQPTFIFIRIMAGVQTDSRSETKDYSLGSTVIKYRLLH